MQTIYENGIFGIFTWSGAIKKFPGSCIFQYVFYLNPNDFIPLITKLQIFLTNSTDCQDSIEIPGLT